MYAFLCGVYMHACMNMCVEINVSRDESTAQHTISLAKKLVNDRQQLEKDKGMYKEKGTAGKVGVKVGCRWR